MGLAKRAMGPDRALCRRIASCASLSATALLVVALGGCGSTTAVVKQKLEYRPAVANAFSRALSFASSENPPTAAPNGKPSSFPPVPPDENNERVRTFVREYAYKQRETMKEYLARGERYLPMVKNTMKEHGLPEDIAYLVMLESGANPEARSPANALGMWQFMPATARSYGLRVDSWVDERLDPKKSTNAAMLYLKDLYGMFGCWRLALSGYNSGENKLNKVLCREDASEYDEICSSRMLKRETREFFPRFLAIAHIAKNPKKYGFSEYTEKYQEPKHEFVPVDGTYSLESIATAMSISPELLADLNPALIRGKTPPSGAPYALRVPVGKKEVLLAQLNTLPADSGEGHIIHVVGGGDNVYRLSKRYNTDRAKIAALNPDVNFRKRLRPGSKIVVPASTHTKKSLRNDKLSRAW